MSDMRTELAAELKRMREFNEWLSKATVTPEMARVIAAAIRGTA